MSLALRTNLVTSTGSEKGDILIGAYLSNRNMRIRVSCAQNKGDNLQIEGDFDLLDAETGKYAEAMAEFVGRHFENGQELIEPLRKKRGADKCTFILHKDMLQVDRHVIREETEIAKPQSGFSELRTEPWSKPQDAPNLLQTLQASLAEVQSCYGEHWSSHHLILPTMETHWNGKRFNVTAQILKDSRTPFETGVFSLAD